MTETPTPTIRDLLAQGQAREALERLSAPSDGSDPNTSWLRACCAAHLGNPLAVHVALRQLPEGAHLPPEALADIAPPYADAVLEHDTERVASWRPLAQLVLATLPDDPPPETDAALAWRLLVQANNPQQPVAADVLRLAGLARQMGWQEQAIDLAQAAQKHARRTHRPDIFAGATCLLAALCAADEDPHLARLVIDHGQRILRQRFPDAPATLLEDGERLVEAWTSSTPYHANLTA